MPGTSWLSLIPSEAMLYAEHTDGFHEIRPGTFFWDIFVYSCLAMPDVPTFERGHAVSQKQMAPHKIPDTVSKP